MIHDERLDMRTFLGLKLDAHKEFHVLLHKLSEFGPAVKTTRPENLHLTLAFLGETDASDLPRISAITTEIVARIQRNSIRVVGLGAFPNPEQPRVIWAGVESSDRLRTLGLSLSKAMTDHGYSHDRLAFKPHITLARVKQNPVSGLEDFFRSYQGTTFGEYELDRVTLYQSTLTSAGPVYEPLKQFSLRGDRTED